MKKKILFIILSVFCLMSAISAVHAASATISASKTSVTVGTKVTITVKVNAVTWNLKVSGNLNDSIVGANMDEKNQTTTKTYTLDTSKAGTYKVYLKGDIMDETSTDYTTKTINTSVTVTVKEKTVTNTNTNTNTNTGTTTTTKKSSNANISKLTLSVEGLKFKTSQTTYNIKVGEDIDKITVGVTLAHKKATYKVTGNKDLKAGNNVIKIVVTAEDGTKKTYKINVEKEGNAEDTSAELSNLIIENMTFTTPFISTETEYFGGEMEYSEKLNILPYTVSEKATYEIIGNKNLKEGENTVIVKVTSYDETKTLEYKVTFNMMPKEETNALQAVNPYKEERPTIQQEDNLETMKEILMENSTIILLYILALIEFGQVIYLYIQLKNVDPSALTVRRRKQRK